ncbi:hypothetical protein NP233_g7586 [Leucocoprinus birnbaumii]|uniref:BTB domain-containing protein n=1 Tax=Leucocoprinus birnbaumii TaxID=56174 RepID=A0AAD5VNV8_9AGAR|nr:hypothetical protein NP233_g7586 [Leucocoprinus birnbaumii]
MDSYQYTPSALFADPVYDKPFGWDAIPSDFKDDISSTSYPSPVSMLDTLVSNPVPDQEETAPMPTSPGQETQSPHSPPNETMISISTVFNPYACSPDSDLLFISSDSVLFYVHSRVLKRTSSTSPPFHRLLRNHPSGSVLDAPPSPVPTTPDRSGHSDKLIAIPDHSSVLNIILHSLYGTSPAQHSPIVDMLIAAVDRMPFYDIKPKDYIVPHSPLYTLILSHAPVSPLKVYTLAGHHDLRELAVATSSHLLYYPLAELPENMAIRMGTIYLHKLMHLHMVRFRALKEILLAPPNPHAPTKYCSFEEQRGVTRAWALVAAYLAWEARADLSPHSMHSAFQPLMKDIICESCLESLQMRLKDAVTRWATVQRSIEN